ncbi:MAG: site-specific integrase [Acidobacteria bacterium]|nr:site-specific integrase [Acidobacteriota bacterium]
MATIEKRVGRNGKITYRVKIRLKDKGHVSQTFERLTSARNWAQKQETLVRENAYDPEAEGNRRTLQEAVDRYIRDILPHKAPSSYATEERRLQWWADRLGHIPLGQITPALITECRDELLSQGSGYTAGRRTGERWPGVSPSTAAKYLRILAHLFTIAINEWQWIQDSPCRRVGKPRENPGRVRFLSREELHRLQTACRESGNLYLLVAFTVSVSTGLRHGELFGLTWDRVDLAAGRCRLESIHTKTGTGRAIYLRGEALHLMRELYANRDPRSDLCFPSPYNPRKPYDIRRPFRNAMQSAEITDFTWHDLRHTCASYLLMNGATLGEVAEVLGHRTLAMVKRYAHIAESHTAAVVERMNKNLFG